jgi:HlyD family secretion protein
MSDSIARAAKSDPPPDETVARTLGIGRKRKRRRLFAVLGVVSVLGALGSWFALSNDDEGPRYKTARSERGAIEVTVSATGRLEAIDTVDVGAEVSGRVLAVHVDFNDRVKKGQLLAEIDTERLVARVDEGAAEMAVAHAETERAHVELDKAEQEHARAKALFAEGLTSRQDLEDKAAEAASRRAALSSANARGRVSGASLRAADTDVGRGRIVSPIDGVVLARNVESGQTLASSFTVPVLFKLARDLRRMKLLVAIDEADVGRVKSGQRASFTVEAYPGRSFRSKVVSLHHMPTIDQGVVSYQAVLEVDNADLALRPGMTATAAIVTDSLSDALLVPNAALRFMPPDEARKMRERQEEEQNADEPGKLPYRVWTRSETGEPRPIQLSVGRSDGKTSEVTGGELEPGTELLIDIETEEDAS